MKHGSLFSGIGGFDLAAEWMGWENVFHCEWKEFNQKVLKYYWQNAISYTDITKTDFSIHRGNIDILTGGFPCQDASQVGQKKGLDGERTGLFFEMCRAIREIKPKFVVAENVANILKINKGKDFSRILSELSGMGYNAEWRICRASEKGSPHKRERLYLVAYSDSIRLQKGQTFIPYVQEKTSPKPWSINGTTIQNLRGGIWSSNPPVLLMDDGFPYPVDGISVPEYRRRSIESAGNAIVPQIAYEIFKAINKINND
jgi:DNA (cytosine-5)-methyltransferase 1